jgi:hypothetical protein
LQNPENFLTIFFMSPEQLAEQLAAEGKCIICNAPADALQRGLCERHRGRFKAAIAKISPENREAFEAQLIANGKLLPNRRGQKLRPEDDEFAVELAAFQASSTPKPKEKPATVAEIAAELLDSVPKPVAPPVPPKPAKKQAKKG